MAAVRSFWLRNKQESKSRFFKSCIFQQMWREHTLPQTLGLESTTIQQKHLSYVARCLLNSLLNHQFDDAIQCMVALCGACLRTPEMFWRTGCEVMSNNTRSYSHLSQFIKNMFVICGPYRTELLLDYAMYLVQHNSDITEANELLTTKLSDKSLQSSVLLKAYAGLFAYLSWKKSKKQLDKKQLDNEEATVYGQDAQNSAASNLKRQMDFHAKQALAMFNNSVEHKGNWDIFVTKQVEILEYYNRSEEARKILEQYMKKNPENPNAYRYLYYFLKSNCTNAQELCTVLEGLLQIDPTSDLDEEYVELRRQQKEQPKGLLDALASLFLKLDHAACQRCEKTWKLFADTLRVYLTTGDYKKGLDELWDKRLDWWPPFHFRPDQVPDRASASELEWQLAQHKAEVARLFLGKENPFSKAVQSQDKKVNSPFKRKRKADSLLHSPKKRIASLVV
ncbi:TATA box-binding protein-associated factor RNA polymerase I subunit A-like [Acropora palmata]|uniref:TATA box-binding protein-associated factor RNA polymerase I subunit A-like n=1 Tax=Acropora palmata TaxID=6131 RepID=UPI003DA0B508